MARTPRLALYLVTDTGLCGGFDGVVETVRAAVGHGVSQVQVRDHAASDEDFATLATRVVEAAREVDPTVPVLLNDRVHLVARTGAHGVHLGQRDQPPVEARALLGPDALIGWSAQTHAHLDALRTFPHGTVDYLGVGPAFPQNTKPDAAPVRGLAHLTDLIAAAPVPCVIIGGITAERLPDVAATGAHGVAVVSALCGQPDPARTAYALRQAWDRTQGADE